MRFDYVCHIFNTNVADFHNVFVRYFVKLFEFRSTIKKAWVIVVTSPIYSNVASMIQVFSKYH